MVSDPAKPTGMRILAIDYGLRRVGLAISDPTGTLATPLQTLPNKGREHLLRAIASVVRETGVARVLIGIPFRTSGSLGPEARHVLEFAHSLAARLGVPVTGRNEAYTTAEAWSRIRSTRRGGRGPRTDRAIIDQIAAAVMLEEYLAHVPATPEPLPAVPPSEPLPAVHPSEPLPAVPPSEPLPAVPPPED